jgi:hypothetical protein
MKFLLRNSYYPTISGVLSLILLSACGNNSGNDSNILDVGFLDINESGRFYVLYEDESTQSAVYKQCDHDSPLPLTRNCEGVSSKSLPMKTFRNGIRLDTMGFPRTTQGLDLARKAYEKALQENRPEAETQAIGLAVDNLGKIIELIEGMRNGVVAEPRLNSDPLFAEVREVFTHTYSGDVSGTYFRYAGLRAAGEANSCRGLGGGWAPVTNIEQLSYKVVESFFKANQEIMVASNLDLSVMYYDSTGHLWSASGIDVALSSVEPCGSIANGNIKIRAITYYPTPHPPSNTTGELVIRAATGNAVCEKALPVLCRSE